MTEEYWQSYARKREINDKNEFTKAMRLHAQIRVIKDQHPDNLYAMCKTDNNYWRHYRASTKLGIDELSMMICRDVGCDLQYC